MNFEMLAEQRIAMEAAVAHISLRERLAEPGFDRANIFLVGDGAVHDVDQCRIFSEICDRAFRVILRACQKEGRDNGCFGAA